MEEKEEGRRREKGNRDKITINFTKRKEKMKGTTILRSVFMCKVNMK